MSPLQYLAGFSRLWALEGSFSWRYTLLWSVMILLVAGSVLSALTVAAYKFETRQSVEHLLKNARLQVSIQKQEMALEIRAVANNILFLTREIENHQQTWGEGAIASLQYDFRSLMLTSGWFDQLRLLDMSGRELIRFNMVNGLVELVPQNKLQDKSSRYYVQALQSLPPGQLYLSSLDLNMEHGEVELPYKPTMRVGMVIDGVAGNKAMIIGNYLAEGLFRRIEQADELMVGDLLLSDAGGNLLVTPDAGERWGTLVGGDDGYTLSARKGSLWQALNGSESGQLLDADSYYVYETIYPLLAASEIPALKESKPEKVLFWKLMLRIDQAQIATMMIPYREFLQKWFIFGMIVLLIVCLPLALLIENRRSTQARIRMLGLALEYAGESIMITDLKGQVEYINPAFTELTGYTEADALGRMPSELLKSQAQDAGFYRQMWQTIAAGDVWQGKVVDRRKDGSLFPAWMSIAPVPDHHGRPFCYIAIQRDYTEHQLLQEKVSQETKMKSLSVAVGGIAHEFNNILSGIVGNVYLMKRLEQDNSGALEKLGRIEKLGQRAAAMVRQMLIFVGHTDIDLRSHIAGDLFAHVLDGIDPNLPDSVELCRDLPWVSGQVMADSAQMHAIVVELIDNACKSIAPEEKGKISFNLRLGVKRFSVDEQEAVCFSISDNGCGIEPSKLSLIFEPFFTTREVGRGTGLGLSTVQGLVAKQGGIIEVSSEPGVGTTFSIWLPLVVANEDGNELGMI